MENVNNPIVEKEKRRLSLTAVIVLAGALSFLLMLINRGGLELLLDSLESNISFKDTALPAIVYYIMSVVDVMALFFAVAGLLYSVHFSTIKMVVAASALMFLSLSLTDIIPFFVAAASYESYTIFDLLATNWKLLLLRLSLNLLRVVLTLVAAYIPRIAGRREERGYYLSSIFAASALALMPIIVQLCEVTVPYFISASKNSIMANLPLIIVDYLLMLLYGFLGFLLLMMVGKLVGKLLQGAALHPPKD